jgi:hypothetical protein
MCNKVVNTLHPPNQPEASKFIKKANSGDAGSWSTLASNSKIHSEKISKQN